MIQFLQTQNPFFSFMVAIFLIISWISSSQHIQSTVPKANGKISSFLWVDLFWALHPSEPLPTKKYVNIYSPYFIRSDSPNRRLPKTNISPENGPGPQKERILFQPSMFRFFGCYFQGGYCIFWEAFLSSVCHAFWWTKIWLATWDV